MNKSQYDNKFSNSITGVTGTFVRTVERSLVVFFDGLRSATEHGTPSLLGFLSAVLPVIMPLPIAGMTAYSLSSFFGWQNWQVITMAAGLEMAGFVLWVTFVETLIKDGWKGTPMQIFFGSAVLVYQVLLIIINGVLSASEGRSSEYVWTLVLLSFLPALSAIAYAYRNTNNTERLAELERMDREEAERLRIEERDLKERIRQERRADRLALKGLQSFASDTDGPRTGNNFRGK